MKRMYEAKMLCSEGSNEGKMVGVSGMVASYSDDVVGMMQPLRGLDAAMKAEMVDAATH